MTGSLRAMDLSTIAVPLYARLRHVRQSDDRIGKSTQVVHVHRIRSRDKSASVYPLEASSACREQEVTPRLTNRTGSLASADVFAGRITLMFKPRLSSAG